MTEIKRMREEGNRDTGPFAKCREFAAHNSERVSSVFREKGRGEKYLCLPPLSII
jgi:hypothetical protein